ncbi:MAG: DUF4330 domain-containing protein [Clostridia bacterium]
MKIIDQKGRLFGKINVVDFIVAAAILASVAAIAVTLLATPIKEAVSPTVTMTSTFRIRGASQFIQEELELHPILGAQLISGSDYVDAYITDVYTEQYVVQTITDVGEIVEAYDPIKVDYVITVESEIAANTPILKIGTQEVRAGRTFTLKTRGFELNASIESVSVDD